MEKSKVAKKVKLTDYTIMQTLGTGRPFTYSFANFLFHNIGSFGRVRLIKSKVNSKHYALKALKKAEIIKLKQVDHVVSETSILASITHPFVVSKA